jgi:UDP-N-acetyl-D-glucosamine dehydrogenase
MGLIVQRRESVADNKLLQLIESKKAKLGIIGMGYVGLPLVREFARAGFEIVGFDVDEKKVRQLNAGRSYIKHIPSTLIRELTKSGRFSATTDMTKLRQVHAILICVPTPLTRMREPDMTYVVGTAESIAKNLRTGHLIVLESTTYPGTTREVVLPILEAGGKRVERDFFLAYSPEREDPGRTDYSTATIPKVVGGYGRRSTRLARSLYAQAIDKVVPVGSCEVAEACKIVENVYRCVNIAMVNELKVLFDRMGIDVWEVIRAASTKPFGYQAFYPGPGLGGHCIPIDPFYLSWKARQYEHPTRFIELAGEINTSMPDYVVGRTAEALNEHRKPLRGSKILILGLAYKKDVDDLRESPSIILIEMLRSHGAKVDYNDPYIPKTHQQREHDLRMRSKPLSPAMLKGYDAVIISTDHSDYDYDSIVEHANLVIDTRNATAKVRRGRGKVVKA